jgi:hypothetical protein
LEDGAISEKVPEEIHLESLPSASPEPQPSERLWPFTNEGVANRFFEEIEDLEKRADERTRTAYPCSSYECAVNGCWALLKSADSA